MFTKLNSIRVAPYGNTGGMKWLNYVAKEVDNPFQSVGAIAIRSSSQMPAVDRSNASCELLSPISDCLNNASALCAVAIVVDITVRGRLKQAQP